MSDVRQQVMHSADQLPVSGGSPRNSCTRWLNEKKFLETALYLIVTLLAFLAPKPALFERPIPYQVLKSGEVILDFELNNPYIEDKDASCPVSLLIVLCFVVPGCAILGYSLTFARRVSGDTHAISCAFLLGLAITDHVTNCLKVYVGRFRPNFCKFNFSASFILISSFLF